MTKIYQTYVDRIDSGVLTKAQIAQFTQAIVPISQGLSPGGKKTTITEDEAQDLIDRVKSRGGVLLTEQHTEQGITWLRRYGEKRLGIPQALLDEFDHFSFQGDAKPFGWRQHIPIWRVHLKDGSHFDYYVTAWQSQWFPGGYEHKGILDPEGVLTRT